MTITVWFARGAQWSAYQICLMKMAVWQVRRWVTDVCKRWVGLLFESKVPQPSEASMCWFENGGVVGPDLKSGVVSPKSSSDGGT